MMDDDYKVWGKPDGRGLVILSDEPVDFHPTNKTANVVHVDSLDDAVRYVNVATQTIGIYPPERKAELRDRLASAGAQRVVRLGGAATARPGRPARRHVPAAPLRALDVRRGRLSTRGMRHAGHPTKDETAQIDHDLREAALQVFLDEGYEGGVGRGHRRRGPHDEGIAVPR